jgi:threonine aldolase
MCRSIGVIISPGGETAPLEGLGPGDTIRHTPGGNRDGRGWGDVDRAIARTASGRVATRVGAISIESPVRRRSGELFDRAEMMQICREAKQREIGTHLDGARVVIASAYTGISPAEYAAPFDTVYVSLWKYFNSINGAILAGPAATLDGLFHVRRMFGGALWNAWPFALLARRYAEGFVERLNSAVAVSEAFIAALSDAHVRVERVTNGTNVFRILMTDVGKAESLRERLRAQAVIIPRPAKSAEGAVFTLQVNETWNRRTGAALAELFQRALG